MVGFKLAAFAGTQPLISPRLLPETNAQVAINQRVESGALEALGEPRLLKALQSSTKFVYRIPNGAPSDIAQSHFIEFADPNTDMVRTPVVNDGYKRYYWASPSTGFRYATESQLISGGAGAGLIGGVPRPATSPTLDIIPRNMQAEAELKVTRSYIVTFITSFGEEGAPSLPVEAEGYEDDIWRLRDIPQPAFQAGHSDVTKVRIYRTETSLSGSTTFNQVVDLQVGVLIYEDTLPSVIVNGQPALDANDNDAPPDMDGLALLPNGVLVGFKGNNLFFSKNYQPHAWPVGFTLAVQHPIVGLAVFGTTCVVCTQGNPAAVTGASGEVMSLTQSDVSMPCVSRQSIITAPEGVYYATSSGLVLYGPSGPTIVSDQLIGRNRWEREYNAADIDAVLFQGGYVGMRYNGAAYSAFHVISGSLVEITVQAGAATQCFCGIDVWSNKPWLIQGGNLYEWFPSNTPARGYQWRSKQFVFPDKVSMGVLQVYAEGPVQVDLYADTRLMFSKIVTNSEPVRIKGGYKTDLWSIFLNGGARLHTVIVAQTVADLKKQ